MRIMEYHAVSVTLQINPKKNFIFLVFSPVFVFFPEAVFASLNDHVFLTLDSMRSSVALAMIMFYSAFEKSIP